jgi:hypothetical protein
MIDCFIRVQTRDVAQFHLDKLLDLEIHILRQSHIESTGLSPDGIPWDSPSANSSGCSGCSGLFTETYSDGY